MKKMIFILSSVFLLYSGEFNNTKEQNISDINVTKEKLTQEAIKKQIEKENQYKKEQKFYMGKDYNLEEHKVNKKILKHIKPIEPEYDFNMDDVYD